MKIAQIPIFHYTSTFLTCIFSSHFHQTKKALNKHISTWNGIQQSPSNNDFHLFIAHMVKYYNISPYTPPVLFQVSLPPYIVIQDFTVSPLIRFYIRSLSPSVRARAYIQGNIIGLTEASCELPNPLWVIRTVHLDPHTWIRLPIKNHVIPTLFTHA